MPADSSSLSRRYQSMTVRSGCVCFVAIVLITTLAAVALRAQPAPAPAPAPAASDKPPHLILITQSKDFVHDVVKPDKDGGPSRVVRTFNELAQRTNLFTIETTDDVTTLTPEKLKGTKLIVFYTTGDLPFIDAGFAAFEQWLKDGGGFLG